MVSFFKEKNSLEIYFFTLFLLLLIILFIRVYSIYVLNIPLHFDEAQYSAHWPATILLFAIALRQRRNDFFNNKTK